MRLFTPDIFLERVVELEASFLQERGIRGLLLDIDGTLKDFRAPHVSPDVIAWIERLRQADLRLCLLSNGRAPRISKLAAALHLPFVAESFKPFPFACHRAMRILKLPATEVAFAGDQLFADHLAGRLAGLFTILVRPTSRDEPWFTQLKRPVESLFVRRLVRLQAETDVVPDPFPQTSTPES